MKKSLLFLFAILFIVSISRADGIQITGGTTLDKKALTLEGSINVQKMFIQLHVYSFKDNTTVEDGYETSYYSESNLVFALAVGMRFGNYSAKKFGWYIPLGGLVGFGVAKWTSDYVPHNPFDPPHGFDGSDSTFYFGFCGGLTLFYNLSADIALVVETKFYYFLAGHAYIDMGTGQKGWTDESIHQVPIRIGFEFRFGDR